MAYWGPLGEGGGGGIRSLASSAAPEMGGRPTAQREAEAPVRGRGQAGCVEKMSFARSLTFSLLDSGGLLDVLYR